jgi:dihydropyrimidine dehydrogenase (NAD+) subunit PreT
MSQSFDLPSGRLEEQFKDKRPRYTPGEAVVEANRCIYCTDAPCVNACPTGIDIPTFIHKIATGNTRGAARTIFDANLLLVRARLPGRGPVRRRLRLQPLGS